jgi:tRNA 2-thiocytidine biosynthesis protein TtcA
MIADWEADFPDRSSVMMNALQNVHPSHLLDTTLFDFKKLAISEETFSIENH